MFQLFIDLNDPFFNPWFLYIMFTYGLKCARSIRGNIVDYIEPAWPILYERVIKLGDFNNINWEGRTLESIFTNRGWGPICDQLGVAYLDLVYKFYQ